MRESVVFWVNASLDHGLQLQKQFGLFFFQKSFLLKYLYLKKQLIAQ